MNYLYIQRNNNLYTVFNEIIIYIFNKITIFTERIIYLFNEIIIFIQPNSH